jgi:hypothetical protein
MAMIGNVPQDSSGSPFTEGGFVVEPFSSGDYAIHIIGGLANLAVTVPAEVFLVSRAGIATRGWPFVVLGLGVAIFVADFVSGLLHWAFDTYFSDRNSSVKRMVVLVREHHIYPDRIFRYSVWREAGLLSWFGVLLAAAPYGVALLAGGVPGPLRWALVLTGLVMCEEITFMLEFHKAGHRKKRGRLVRGLQKARLLLTPDHHLQHHAGQHDSHYCLINGVADDTLGRLGAFRALEAAIRGITGVRAREHDKVLLTRFGRL